MFESFARGRSGKNRWRAPIVASGALLHVALFTGMWLNGLWEIKKVEAAEEPLTLSAMVQIPRVEEAGKASEKPKEDKPKPRIARDPHQPEEQKDTTPPVTDTAPPGDEEDPPGGDTGDDDGIPGGGTITEDVPPVVVAEQPKKPPTLPVIKPVAVLPSALVRTHGDKLILPDAETAQQISRGDAKVRGQVQLCLGTDGVVRSASIKASTGFVAYDAKLEREMSKWRYQPHRVNGVATPVCTMITVIYQQR